MVERKFIAQGSDLYEIAKWAEKGTSDQDTITVFISNGIMRMESWSGKRAVRTATSITQNFPDDIRFSISSALLIEAVHKMEKQEITLSFERTRLVMTTKKPRMRYSLPITVTKEVRQLPEFPELIGTVPVKEFKTIVNYVANATSKEESLPALQAITFHIEPQNSLITLRATDRYSYIRRSMKYTPNPDANKESFELYVFPSQIKDILSNISDTETIELFAEPKSADTANSSSTVKSNFFGIGSNIASVAILGIAVGMPVAKLNSLEKNASDTYLTVNRKNLLLAVNNMKSSVTGGIKVALLKYEDEELTLVSDSSNKDTKDIGFEMEVEIVDTNFDEDFELKVNVDYINTVLRAGNTPNVIMEFGNPKNQGSRAKPIIVFDLDDNNQKDLSGYSLFMPVLA